MTQVLSSEQAIALGKSLDAYFAPSVGNLGGFFEPLGPVPQPQWPMTNTLFLSGPSQPLSWQQQQQQQFLPLYQPPYQPQAHFVPTRQHFVSQPQMQWVHPHHHQSQHPQQQHLPSLPPMMQYPPKTLQTLTTQFASMGSAPVETKQLPRDESLYDPEFPESPKIESATEKFMATMRNQGFVHVEQEYQEDQQEVNQEFAVDNERSSVWCESDELFTISQVVGL